jgi:hypothetical protein
LPLFLLPLRQAVTALEVFLVQLKIAILMTQKLYCYVDESGQDSQGALFVVAVVIVGVEREQCRQECETIALQCRKLGKWHKTSEAIRLTYMQHVFSSSLFEGKLFYAVYRDSNDYLALTIRTIALAIHAIEGDDNKAVVLVDALPRHLESTVSNGLHKWGIRTRKVRGIRKDEHDPLMGLADSLCGLVRDAVEGKSTLVTLLSQGLRHRVLKELTEK